MIPDPEKDAVISFTELKEQLINKMKIKGE